MNLDRVNTSFSEHLKNCSTTNEKNSPKTSNITNDTSINKNSPDNSQINEEECKFIINVLKSNDVDLHSQNEETLLKIVKKYEKHILPLNNENIELNTQSCMDLLLHRATIDLQNQQNVSKNQNIEQMDSDDIIIATPPSKFKPLNSIQKNEGVFNTINKDQEQDPDLITFKTMCDALLTIAVDNVTLNNSPIKGKNNQENSIIFKQINADVICCINKKDCAPDTSKLNSAIDDSLCSKPDTDISNNLAHKRRLFKKLMLDSSGKSSPEYLNKLSQKQYNKNTDVISCKNSMDCVPGPSKLNSALDSKCNEPDSDKTKHLARKKRQFKNAVMLDSSGNSSPEFLNELSQKEFNCPNKKFKFKSSKNISKKINTFVRKEENGFFYCAPGGKIHQDMLAFINKQKYGC